LADSEHHIDIEYMPVLGDVKEAWDSVLLEGFTNVEIQLQIHWRALDSPIAAQMILDIIRLITAEDGQIRAGLRADLGFFFKHPFGSKSYSPTTQFRNLLLENSTLLNEDVHDVIDSF
jgi:myo-inositol-1-phosphate synthase